MKYLARWNREWTSKSVLRRSTRNAEHQEQIQFEFDQLQQELEAEIATGQQDAREKLLNNFDQEVVEKVRIQSHDYLDRFNQQLWTVTRYQLEDFADFAEDEFSFMLHTNPFAGKPSTQDLIEWASG